MKKLLALTMVGLLGILSIAGCAKKEAAVDSEKTKITISEMRGESWIPVYAAEMLGYFDEEGLDPEWVVFKDGPIAFQGMHAGDSDFCMLSTEPVLRAYDEGLESKIILSTAFLKSFLAEIAPANKNCPPRLSLFSNKIGVLPVSFKSRAASIPAIPPPKMTTFLEADPGFKPNVSSSNKPGFRIQVMCLIAGLYKDAQNES